MKYRLLLLASSVPLFLLFSGCTSKQTENKIDALDKKIDRVLQKLTGTGPGPVINGPDELNQLRSKLDELLARTPPTVQGIDTSKLSRESTSDLAWFLISNNPKEKNDLACRRIENSSKQESITRKSIATVANDLEALNVMLNAPELLDANVLQKIEDARNRLVELLRSEIPGLAHALDAEALKSTNYAESKRLWAESSAMLGFYPSSNDPVEAGRIQKMVSSHDLVLARIELLQQQHYNLWACKEIRKAWRDFTDNTNNSARMQTCLHFLGPIHPGLLNPVSLELYRDFLQTIREKIGPDLYQDLAERIAMKNRKLLADLEIPEGGS